MVNATFNQEPSEERINSFRKHHPDAVLLWRGNRSDNYVAFGDDASRCLQVVMTPEVPFEKVKADFGLVRFEFSTTGLEEMVKSLVRKGNRVAIVEFDQNYK